MGTGLGLRPTPSRGARRPRGSGGLATEFNFSRPSKARSPGENPPKSALFSPNGRNRRNDLNHRDRLRALLRKMMKVRDDKTK
jgi:hypothetical protein